MFEDNGTVCQRPWVQFLAAPPFFPALSPFQRSLDVMALSIIRPGLIGLQTKIIGVPTIGLPAVIPLRFSMITTFVIHLPWHFAHTYICICHLKSYIGYRPPYRTIYIYRVPVEINISNLNIYNASYNI